MGLSSSQARLLNLTGRMHQIEYKAAKLEAQKLQMANESRKVYDEYLNALEKTKIQIKTMNPDASATFVDASYNALSAAGYKFKFVGDYDYMVSGGFIDSSVQLNTVPAGYTAINSASDLQNISRDGKYILMSDIDMSGIDNACISQFSGTLNGNGHVIRNLTVNNPGGCAGLFQFLNGATIENLGIEDANVSGNTAGILAGSIYNGATINNCYVTGTVSGSWAAGGMLGDAGSSHDEPNLNISDCYVDANISARTYAGGFCANTTFFGPTITNSYTSGTITGDYAGAAIGGPFSYDYRLNNIYSTAIVNGSTNSGMAGVAHVTGNVGYNNVYYAGESTLNDNIENEMSLVNKISQNELNKLIDSGALPMMNYAPPEEYRNSTEWLTNMINEGQLILMKPDSKGEYYDVSVSTDTGLQEVSDEKELRKAEAKYEADMRRIDYKDRKYDYDLAALDAERNAVKNEMETLKTVAKDNVERTFRLFS